MRTSMGCCTTRDCRLYLKSFEPSLLAGTTTTLWQVILVSIKQESSSTGSIIGRASERTSRPTSRAATFVWLRKRSGISPTAICRPCQHRLTNGKTSQWTLWPSCQFQPIGRVTINTPGLAEVIFNVVVWHHDLPNLIIFDKSLLFTSKFWPHAFRVELWLSPPDVL